MPLVETLTIPSVVLPTYKSPLLAAESWTLREINNVIVITSALFIHNEIPTVLPIQSRIFCEPTANFPRTAKPPNFSNLREPLQTEAVLQSFGKSGCRDLNPGPLVAANPAPPSPPPSPSDKTHPPAPSSQTPQPSAPSIPRLPATLSVLMLFSQK